MTVREQAIQLKLKMANEIMAEIPILIEKKFYTTAINRLYYSCFHATKALLLTKDLTPKTHKGVVILLRKHFVDENLFDEGKASFFADLMQERNESDYGDFLIVSFEDIESFILPAKEYLNYITGLINSIQNK